MGAKIKGRRSLSRKLIILPKAIEDQIKRAMEAAAQDMVDLAKSLVPKDSHELEESIDWTWGQAPRGALTLGNVRGKEVAGKLTITVYAGNDVAYYARWVEFGTRPHNVAKGGGTVAGRIASEMGGGGRQHPGTSAQPFFYVSYRATRRKAKSRIGAAVTRGAKKVALGSFD